MLVQLLNRLIYFTARLLQLSYRFEYRGLENLEALQVQKKTIFWPSGTRIFSRVYSPRLNNPIS